ncbi:hypothetical protein M408DRAFT_6198 [Serendipita vermifera MAFF 305830]|uniref:Uncharacterized protein n=1 Tax=Serendipita vermifera MAFF 305830 TaxID=933852 RepID=A0A0C3BMS0_SERVB|nr:hypothetical protein M408DRAFT_6198 [Serendipita vermifera MAFF 305830]
MPMMVVKCCLPPLVDDRRQGTMSTRTLALLCDKLPTELAMRILKAGAASPDYGHRFGARCMRLALWVQPIIGPILYRVVTIRNIKQGQSLFLAITRNIKGKGYTPRALIKSLVVCDDSREQAKDTAYATVIAEIIILLHNGGYKRLDIPLHLIGYSASSISYTPPLPYSVTFRDVKGSLFSDYSYGSVVKIRLPEFDPQMWEIRALLSVAKKVSHISLTLSSNAWAAMGLVDAVSRLPQIKVVVVVVKMSPDEEEHLPQLLKLKEEPPTWVEGIIVSKVFVWQWNSEVQKLLDDEDDNVVWNAAKNGRAPP